jgi:hypothetical protein
MNRDGPKTTTVIFQLLLPDISLYASNISTFASSYIAYKREVKLEE